MSDETVGYSGNGPGATAWKLFRSIAGTHGADVDFSCKEEINRFCLVA